ncbi:MAG: hypothetical protein PVI00_00385 [Desulfobacterales bacterium]|jgi:hypothetical protein
MPKSIIKIVQNRWQVGGGNFTAAKDAAVYMMRFEQQKEYISSLQSIPTLEVDILCEGSFSVL